MSRKALYLIAGILASAVFIGFLGETEPKSLFGVEVNIWVFRLAWLILAISFFNNYLKLKKSEMDK